jgi:hypothetical protein
MISTRRIGMRRPSLGTSAVLAGVCMLLVALIVEPSSLLDSLLGAGAFLCILGGAIVTIRSSTGVKPNAKAGDGVIYMPPEHHGHVHGGGFGHGGGGHGGGHHG